MLSLLQMPSGRVIAGFIAFTACCVIANMVVLEFNKARQMAEHSAQMALFEEAEVLLDRYRAEHGAYPQSLGSLKFTFPDGGHESMLELLEYESDGESYAMVTIDFTGQAYRKSRQSSPD